MLGDHRTRSSIVASPIGPDLGDGEIARALLEAVAEKTGYPVEMLELDMRLDDDLGIDSIKRVEILSALQECFPQMPPASPEQVGTVGTLRDIVALLSPAHRTAMGDPPGTATQAAEVTHGQDPRDTSSVAHILLDAVSEKTGYPAEMLDLDMRLDDDLGIDSIKRVEILSAVQDRLPGTRSIGPEQTGTLRTLRELAEFLAPDRPASGPETPVMNGRVSVTPGINGKETHVEPRVVLCRLEPRAVPLELPGRREAVKLPPGGMIEIVDDGSPLTVALRTELAREDTARESPREQVPPSSRRTRACAA